MELTIEKTKGNLAGNSREVKHLDVYVGSRSVKTNDRKRTRGQATVRLVLRDTTFAILQLRAFVASGMEHGKYYQIKAIVETTTRRDSTSRVEVAEILSVAEIEGFEFEARNISYVRPETEEVEAPSID